MAGRVGPSGRVVALDTAAQLVAFASASADGAGTSDVLACRTGRAEALPFPDGAFDRSFCRWLLVHTDAPDRVVREMRQVTRPGGRVMCVEVDWETATVHPASGRSCHCQRSATGHTSTHAGQRVGRGQVRL
jgi:ubiquinone/menaquinone biosynthesis C-methylase UbiE